MKLIYKINESESCFVESYSEVSGGDLATYADKLFMSGYKIVGERTVDKNRFLNMRRGNDAVFLAYYDGIRELRAVYEKDTKYFDFKDEKKAACTSPAIIQVDIIDYGLSYVVKLSDGRFIILDGGWDTHGDEDRLMDALAAESLHGMPEIALWIFTHPHIDHYRCVMPFVEKYGDRVKIERFMYNFAEEDPTVQSRLEAEGESKEILNRFYDTLRGVGAPVYTAHTGQVYTVGDAELEILCSPDDAFYDPPESLNNDSLIIKMTLGGQRIMFPADANFASVKLAARWGRYLKSDILQVTHHGFPGGDVETYDLIAPSVCIVPNDEVIYFENSCIHRRENKHIVYEMDVDELLIGGSGNIKLELPYKASTDGKARLSEMAARHRENIGECEQTATGKIKIENKTFFDVNISFGIEKFTLAYQNSVEKNAGAGTLIISDYPVKVTKI